MSSATSNPCRPANHDFAARTGVCLHCDHVACEVCGAVLLASAAHESPTGWGCSGCAEDSDGIPVAVDAEDSGAQTVETRTLSDSELLALLDTMVEMREAA